MRSQRCLESYEKNESHCVFVFYERSLPFMALVTVAGTGFGAYIMAMAVLSPCPLLVNNSSGTTVIVSFVLVF